MSFLKDYDMHSMQAGQWLLSLDIPAHPNHVQLKSPCLPLNPQSFCGSGRFNGHCNPNKQERSLLTRVPLIDTFIYEIVTEYALWPGRWLS